jgi:hypothetical protein
MLSEVRIDAEISCTAAGHGEYYFSHPDEMITGKVIDPQRTLDNYEIMRRHDTAFLLQS